MNCRCKFCPQKNITHEDFTRKTFQLGGTGTDTSSSIQARQGDILVRYLIEFFYIYIFEVL